MTNGGNSATAPAVAVAVGARMMSYDSAEIYVALGLTRDQFLAWLSRGHFTPEHAREGRAYRLTFGDAVRAALLKQLNSRGVTLPVAGRIVHELPRAFEELRGWLFVARLAPSLRWRLVPKDEPGSGRGADIVVDLDKLAHRLELSLEPERLPSFNPAELAERITRVESGTAHSVEQFVKGLLDREVVCAGPDGRLGFEDSALAFIAWLTCHLRLSDDELRGLVAGLRWKHGAPEAGADDFGQYRRLWRVEGERRTLAETLLDLLDSNTPNLVLKLIWPVGSGRAPGAEIVIWSSRGCDPPNTATTYVPLYPMAALFDSETAGRANCERGRP